MTSVAAIRRCEELDLAEFGRRGIGTQLIHAAEDAVRAFETSEFVYPGAPVPNPGVLMRRDVS